MKKPNDMTMASLAFQQVEFQLPNYGFELEKDIGYVVPPAKVTTPAAREGTIKLSAANRTDVIILKARVPVSLTLEGPPDLLFQSLTLTLEAQPLVRNLNQASHQVVVAPVPTPTDTYEFRLPEPAYVDRVQMPSLTATVKAIGPGGQEKDLVRNVYTFACGMSVSAIRVGAYTADRSAVNILSPSSASQVVVALPDGTPLHSFPAVFDPAQGITAASRDLAEPVNQVWAASGGKLELAVTAMTDGALKVTAGGQWRRTARAVVEHAVHPFADAEAVVPLGAGWKQAQLRLTVDAAGTGGLTTHMQPEPEVALRRFGVRVTETLQVAQAFCLRSVEEGAEEALPALHVTGVWLCLPAVPDQAQEVDLRLTCATAQQQPDPTPLLLWKAKLPADAAAYVQTGAEVWFRAPCPKPLEIDGTTAGQPLFLVASGHGTGTLLVHRNLNTKLEPVTPEDLDDLIQDGDEVEFPVDLPGRRQLVGSTLVSNLAVDRGWALQRFNCYNALWRFELELAPDAPSAPLVTAELPGALYGEGTVPEGLKFEGVELTFPAVAATSPLHVKVRSRACGTVTLRALAEEVE